MNHYNYFLTRAKVVFLESPHPLYFILRVSNPGGSACMPGQFAMLRLPDGQRGTFFLSRPFSVMESGETLGFLVKIVGRGTRALRRLERDDDIDIMVPLGKPFPDLSRFRDPFFVAGGTGAAPIHFLAKFESQQGRERRVLYGARSRDELVLWKAMGEASRLEVATEDGTAGYMGLVTDLLEERLESSGCDFIAACGPRPLLERAARLGKERGIECAVSVESMMGCGFGACLGCAVPKRRGGYLYACKDGPVMNAESIDWERFYCSVR